MGLLSSFFAREDRFFGLLRSSANNLTEVSALLVDLMDGHAPTEVERRTISTHRLLFEGLPRWPFATTYAT